ncbi:hypothetical protein CWI42_040730 [Ordospora colligata]|uniref:Uncharacterized protein n=1 Tax=Ordospora colligata OC4 TaxID=1354746 RepID=A0A0B2UKJ9_9MICR|nr:uncharacterized protein M896_040730 [Ordospora colligata OC4]KHN69878.1 hypothetical protein M896_040730 [Ordospora colligata OC4]TBU16048.1 hypothetical protein CWI41_040730 [Ordospora colligata]TBU16261.1 hypothetical protein CWI40_040730 [Ordospora colligata]TBU18965.1 hypothetical protein CWI42_040730 [Ordospora colligata]
MYEQIFKTDMYHIVAYMSSRSGLPSSNGCIYFSSTVQINFPKGFVHKENNMLFCKANAQGCNSYLKALSIKHITSSLSGFRVLRNLFPSIFDTSFIHRINVQHHIYQHRQVIMESSIKILGSKLVNEINLWSKINWTYGCADQQGVTNDNGDTTDDHSWCMSD